MKPIELTLYDPETSEKVKTYIRSFVPWAILKRAIRMSKSLGGGDLTEEDMDELGSLVVAVFGDQFSLEEVNNGADIGEMMTVIMEVISRASQFVAGEKVNPPPANGMN
jgi:hypothetical protein